jgi:hypothetical protein
VKPVRPNQEAEDEIRAAIAWYESEREGLGRELWVQLQETVALISEHPTIGSVVHRAKVAGVARRLWFQRARERAQLTAEQLPQRNHVKRHRERDEKSRDQRHREVRQYCRVGDGVEDVRRARIRRDAERNRDDEIGQPRMFQMIARRTRTCENSASDDASHFRLFLA